MNKERRKQIKQAIQRIEDLVHDILDDERGAYDNMPEGLQASENGMISEEAQESLEAAVEALEEAIEYLEEIVLVSIVAMEGGVRIGQTFEIALFPE